MISSIFWTVCVCIHFFILVVYRNPKRASRIAYVYYVIAWLVPLGISLWLLFHNWLGFEPSYSTVNCVIRTQCVPHHHPYHYNTRITDGSWNRTIGALFGLKIWQALALLIIPGLYLAIKIKNKKWIICNFYLLACISTLEKLGTHNCLIGSTCNYVLPHAVVYKTSPQFQNDAKCYLSFTV